MLYPLKTRSPLNSITKYTGQFGKPKRCWILLLDKNMTTNTFIFLITSIPSELPLTIYRSTLHCRYCHITHLLPAPSLFDMLV